MTNQGTEMFDVPCYWCGDMYMAEDWDGPGFCTVDCAAAYSMGEWLDQMREQMDALGVTACQAGQALHDLIAASVLRAVVTGTGPFYHPPPDIEPLGTSPLEAIKLYEYSFVRR